MIPLIGKDAFAAWAAVAKLIHNYAGPVFGVTLVLLLLMLLPHNIPNGNDVRWFLKGGGLLSKNSHPPAGRMNGGEKAWYWLLATVGVAVIVTGGVMIFILDLTREQSQIALTVHAISSLIITAVALGHIYIGTAGTEGSLEGMTTGKVDLNWARQHHDLRVEDLQRKGQAESLTRRPIAGFPPARTPGLRRAFFSVIRCCVRRCLSRGLQQDPRVPAAHAAIDLGDGSRAPRRRNPRSRVDRDRPA
ncbi:MAG: formate dehydrogenase subunit gamma [Burkholderiaceae bacterium]